MEDRTLSRLAWVAFGLIALSFVGSLAWSVVNGAAQEPAAWGDVARLWVEMIAMLSFPLVGVLVASRQPRNAVGWILLAIGFVWEVGTGVAANYVTYGYLTAPGSMPRPDLVAALASSNWVPGIGLIGTFLILLFPDGRLPSPRWRLLAWVAGLALVASTVIIPVTPGPLSEVAGDPSLPDVANPLGIEALRPFLGPLYVFLVLIPLSIVGCALSVIVRWRRSRGLERLQLKWLAAGAGVTAVIYLFVMAFSLFAGGPWGGSGTPVWLGVLQGVAFYSFVLIPTAVGIAILRHRLYDIDIIVNRALVYGALTAALALVYVTGVVGLGAIARTVSGQESENLPVAASTLAVAALFGPLRRRVQALIDRRFYRHKYDIEQTLADFSHRLRDRVDLDSLDAELVDVVARTMQPTHVSVWLKTSSS